MTAVLTIKRNNGTTVELPTPAEIKWNLSDLDGDSSTRNQNGDLFRDRVAVKRKVECSWLPLNGRDMAALLTAVSDPFFELTYPDALAGANRTMTCYVGDRSAPIMRPNASGEWLWGSVSMNFIER
jgi:hypothetical protein